MADIPINDVPQLALGGSVLTIAVYMILRVFRERTEVTQEWKELYREERRQAKRDNKRRKKSAPPKNR